MNFSDMNLKPDIFRALTEMEIVKPTEVQERAIPIILKSTQHIMAQAKTGTGKTLAFSIPIAENIDPSLQKVQAIILVPTRELCKQVFDVFTALCKFQKIKAVEVYGGVSIDRQIQIIHEGAQVIVATPGRLIDIYERHEVSFNNIKFVVLDEADRMLDMGFFPDIEFLLLKAMGKITPRLFLFSATLLPVIKDLVKRFTHDIDVIEINVSHDELTVENCAQFYYLIDDFKDKYYHFIRILRQEKPKHSLIFVNTKKTGEWLYSRLIEERNLNFKVDLIQGDLSQHQREVVLAKFRDQKINTLIATDVAARGLDIPEVTHVFNYDIPEFEENYVHRIGRTSRVQISGESAKGTAISLVMRDEFNLLCRIEGFMNKEIKQRELPPRSAPGSNPSHHSVQERSTQHPHFSSNHSFHSRKPQNREFHKGTKGSRKKDGDNTPDRRQFLY